MHQSYNNSGVRVTEINSIKILNVDFVTSAAESTIYRPFLELHVNCISDLVLNISTILGIRKGGDKEPRAEI